MCPQVDTGQGNNYTANFLFIWVNFIGLVLSILHAVSFPTTYFRIATLAQSILSG